MQGGFIAIAVGAFLDFAVKTGPVKVGVNLHTLGVILMTVGTLAVVLPVISNAVLGVRRQRTIVEEDEGYGLHREDTFL
jgi:uncharacterized membrane protein